MIEKIVSGGAGLARAENAVVLIPGSLPGETLEAETTGSGHGVRHGRITKLLDPSPKRIPPACPLFLRCGGCDFLHTPYPNELDLKQQILAETLERIGKMKPALLPPVPSPAPEFYRRFVQLKIDAHGHIGLFRKDSHEVVPFEGDGFSGCRIQHDQLNRTVAALQGRLTGFKVAKFRMGDEGFVVNLTSDQESMPSEELIQTLKSIGVTGLLINDHPVFGSPEVLYIYGEAPGRIYHLRVSSDAFFQTDPSVVQRIVKSIEAHLQDVLGSNRLNMNLLDLYAGVGTFGILIAHTVLGVYSIELSHSAVSDLEYNMAQNRILNLLIHRGTATSFLKRFRGDAGAVIVDPPRAGLEPAVRQALLKLASPLVFYVSCHPATLARDLLDLTASGLYRVESVQIFDQFGRTHHIECLAVLRLAVLRKLAGQDGLR